MRPYWKFVEAALPPFLIFGMQLAVEKLGFPQTPGIKHIFAKAARDAMADVPVIERAMPQAITKEVANNLTAHLSPRDPRDLLLACLAFTPFLAENGLHGKLTDPLPQLALQEIRDFSLLGQWVIDEKWVTATAMQMLMRARLLGYYIRD